MYHFPMINLLYRTLVDYAQLGFTAKAFCEECPCKIMYLLIYQTVLQCLSFSRYCVLILCLLYGYFSPYCSVPYRIRTFSHRHLLKYWGTPNLVYEQQLFRQLNEKRTTIYLKLIKLDKSTWCTCINMSILECYLRKNKTGLGNLTE